MSGVCTTGVSSIKKKKKTTSKSLKPKETSMEEMFCKLSVICLSQVRDFYNIFHTSIAVQPSDSDSDHESKDVQVQKNTITMQTTSGM